MFTPSHVYNLKLIFDDHSLLCLQISSQRCPMRSMRFLTRSFKKAAIQTKVWNTLVYLCLCWLRIFSFMGVKSE